MLSSDLTSNIRGKKDLCSTHNCTYFYGKRHAKFVCEFHVLRLNNAGDLVLKTGTDKIWVVVSTWRLYPAARKAPTSSLPGMKITWNGYRAAANWAVKTFGCFIWIWILISWFCTLRSLNVRSANWWYYFCLPRVVRLWPTRGQLRT